MALVTRAGSEEERVLGLVGIDEAVAHSGHVVVRVGVLQRVRHVDRSADVLDPERRVSGRKIGIRESARNVDADEGAVEHVHAAPMEI